MTLLLLLMMLQARGATIQGTIVRAGAAAAANNREIVNATVELRGAGITAQTNSKGQFTLLNVPAGRYTLAAAREGFVIQEDRFHGISSIGLAVKVESGQILKDVVVPMIPTPALAGHVFHPDGEPLAAAVVQAYARRYTPDGSRLKVVARTLTNDLGEFRLFWLVDSEYVVDATYNDYALRSVLGRVRLSANFAKPDDGYAAVFYANGRNPSEARIVRAGSGVDEGNLSIIVNETPRFAIRGQVIGPLPLPPDLRIAFAAAGNDVIADSTSGISPMAGGDFEVGRVSPGPYVFLATSSILSSNLVTVNVRDSDVDHLTIPLLPTTNVSGRVSMLQAFSSVNGTRITLTRSDANVEQRIRALADAQGAFVLPNVGVGDYDVYVTAPGAGAYIRNARFAGADVLSQKLRITANTNATLQIDLSVAASGVDGQVVDARGNPGGGVTVVLIPEVRFRRRTDRYFTAVADGAGNFGLNRIPPGHYTAYAFEKIEPESYYVFAHSAEVNRRFAGRGVEIDVNDGGRLPLQLISIPADETAGGFR